MVNVHNYNWLTFFKNPSATMRALAFNDIFISLISLSISSINCKFMSLTIVIKYLAAMSRSISKPIKGVVTYLNNKIHQFVFVHLLCMKVCDQKADVIALK